ncbi:MAG: CBS domain-containing protein [Solirubrobacteraceae bacterium]
MQTAQDIMIRDPETVAPEAPLTEVAALMRDADTGMVPIVEGERLRGVVTDRDIVIRALAEGRDAEECAAGDICTAAAVTAAPGDDVSTIVRQMREADVRRIPVVQDQRVVGVISIGDLAIERDPTSALADISAGAPDR